MRYAEGHIILSERPVMKWTHHGDVYVCGYGVLDDRRLTGDGLADQVRRYCREERWDELLRELNGCFAIICETERVLFAATDHIRSIPLFYHGSGDNFLISDRAESIRAERGLSDVGHLPASEYLTTGFVSGSGTLYEGLKQLRPGEYLLKNRGERSGTETIRYFEYMRSGMGRESDTQRIERLDEMHRSVFERLAESLGGRRAVVPLSGGYDSRLIAVMLDRVGYDNVQYVSYGKPGNWESRISKEVADHLGRPWTFVPVTRQKWHHWFNSPERREYSAYADQLSSYAHIQDFPIVWELKRLNRIPEDAIFIPGHSGGLLTGSHVPSRFLRSSVVTRRQLEDHIMERNCIHWSAAESDPCVRWFRQKIGSVLDIPGEMEPAEAADHYENWVWQERQAKYIVPSIRVYEYWGYDWRIPLWDRELCRFWLEVSAGDRAGKSLYLKYLKAKMDLPVTEANSPRLAKAWQRYNSLADPHFGRFNGNRSLIRSLFQRLEDAVDPAPFPFEFLPFNRPLYLCDAVAVCALRYLEEILDRTSSAIRKKNGG